MAPQRAVLVATAANPLPAAPFVDAAVRLLQGDGIAVTHLDLEQAEQAEVEQVLHHAQLVFMTGGYAMFLLQHVQRTGFERIVRPAVRSGRMAYVGISAGAALAGPTLRYFCDTTDPGVVASTAGLGLVPFTVLPHRNRGRSEQHDRQILHSGTNRYISINDDQAITVRSATWRLLESP